MRDAGAGLTLARIAELLGGRIVGDRSRFVRRVATLDEAGVEDLSLLAHPKYRREARGSSAGALLVREGLELQDRDQVIVKEPHLGLAILLPLLHPDLPIAGGVSPAASIAKSARLGEGASVGPFAVLEEGCSIGAGAIVGAGCYVGAGSEVGDRSILHPNTTIYHGCRLGRGVVVHSGSVIGSDGFGYATEGGTHRKIPQVGGVVLEDEVEIGAGVTIDRGSIGTTRVGRGTKIDNLVQIGHNVSIGRDCLIVAQVGISGSTRIGAGSVFAGQSGAAGHLSVGSRVVVASKSAVYEDLPDGSFVAGIPAVDHRRWKKAQALLARLPELRSRLVDLARRIAVLEGGSLERARARSGGAKAHSRTRGRAKESISRSSLPGAGEEPRRDRGRSWARAGAAGRRGSSPRKPSSPKKRTARGGGKRRKDAK